MVYDNVSDIDFLRSDVPTQDLPGHVLMTNPRHFEVTYVINPHMAGNVGTVQVEKALSEWTHLRSAYADLGFDVQEIEGAEGQPDMVFCANQSLPYQLPSGETGVFLSQMNAPQRQGEVAFYESFFQAIHARVRKLSSDICRFEGMGDAIWHPGRFLLWGGYGFRTDRAVYSEIASAIGVRVLTLLLEDPDFYHLDTCLSVLDENTALIYPGAFQREGLDLIRSVFPRVVDAPEGEARTLFACNAHCPNGTDVLIQKGCDETMAALSQNGFRPIPVETGEFLKAGGSVFCMKLMYW